MLGYAWVQLLQRVLNCFPKRLYFIFTQHGHVLVNTQYCVREEFFPSSPALPYRLSIVHVSWWFHCYPGLALCKNIFIFLKYLIEIHIVRLMSCLSSIDIRHMHFNFYVYWTCHKTEAQSQTECLGEVTDFGCSPCSRDVLGLKKNAGTVGNRKCSRYFFWTGKNSLKFVVVKRSNFGANNFRMMGDNMRQN